MSHNYYLYHDPDTGQLSWISWDHNMAMSSGKEGGEIRGPGGRSVSLDKADVDDNWPLIRYLLDALSTMTYTLTTLRRQLQGLSTRTIWPRPIRRWRS